jgi:hypothetical protein
MKKAYPAADGWLTARLRLQPGATITEAEAKTFVTAGKPGEYEFAEYKPLKTVIVIIFRKIKSA